MSDTCGTEMIHANGRAFGPDAAFRTPFFPALQAGLGKRSGLGPSPEHHAFHSALRACPWSDGRTLCGPLVSAEIYRLRPHRMQFEGSLSARGVTHFANVMAGGLTSRRLVKMANRTVSRLVGVRFD